MPPTPMDFGRDFVNRLRGGKEIVFEFRWAKGNYDRLLAGGRVGSPRCRCSRDLLEPWGACGQQADDHNNSDCDGSQRRSCEIRPSRQPRSAGGTSLDRPSYAELNAKRLELL